MMPVIVALPLGYVGRKIAGQNVFIQDAIYMCLRVYPPSPTVELQAFFIFTSGCGTSNFRFRGFFFCFRRLFLLNGRIIFRFARFGTSNFRFMCNFRFRLSRCRILMHDQHWRWYRCRRSLDALDKWLRLSSRW
jgi:hypothetical protein